MKIGLNALSLVPGRIGGGEIYMRGLMQGLAEVDSHNEYAVFVNRDAADLKPAGENFSVVVCNVRGTAKANRTLYEQLALPRQLEKRQIKLLHSLGTVAPLRMPGVSSVVTIHDVIFMRFPNEFSLVQRGMATFLVSRSARAADAVITISKHSRKDIAEVFGVQPERISVAPLASTNFADQPAEVERFFSEHHLPDRYVYTASSTYYHKNLDRLLEAFALVRQQNEIPHKLVVSGLRMAAHEGFTSRIRSLGLVDHVVFTGWAPDAVMRGLYTRADCFVFPSLYEGFGLPVAEAMALGVPVACSHATSLPEVAGDAAVMFDPEDTNAMALAISSILRDPDLRRRLAADGLRRAAEFSWRKCATETLAVYKRFGIA